jgi:hypothetical protein
MDRRKGKDRKSSARSAKADKAARPRLSLANPPTGFTMSVEELGELLGSGRNQAYEAVRRGVYPSIRVGGGSIKVLTAPTLAILRGEMPPGPATPPTPITERRKAERERRVSP